LHLLLLDHRTNKLENFVFDCLVVVVVVVMEEGRFDKESIHDGISLMYKTMKKEKKN